MRIKVQKFTPLKDKVFISDLDHGTRINANGIIIPDDDMKDHGIRPRWGKVYAVGPEVSDLSPGEWIFVEHGRWSNGFDLELPSGMIRIWQVDYPKAVLLARTDSPFEGVSKQVSGSGKWKFSEA